MYRLILLTIVLATTSTVFSQPTKQPQTRAPSNVDADGGIAVSQTTKGKNTKPSRRFRTLICVRDVKGKGVVRLLEGKKTIWTIGGLKNPTYAELLTNGNVLIAENGHLPYPERVQVTERTAGGKVVWKHDVRDPRACFRLKDGRTAIIAERRVFTVTKDGTRKFQDVVVGKKSDFELPLTRGGGMLADGTIGILRSGEKDFKLVEFTADGKKRTTSITSNNGNDATGIFAELPNGDLLIPQTFANQVIRLDKARKKVTTFAEIKRPNGVQLLPDGNIMVTTYKSGIVTFAPSGKKLKTETLDAVRLLWAAKKYLAD